MKVIFLKDVARTGRKYEIKEVPDGHAQNYLIPRGLAEVATEKKIQMIAVQKEHTEVARAEADARFQEIIKETTEAPLKMSAPANEQGHLFKGLRAVDIAHELSKRSGTSIDASSVSLNQPIKEAGVHTVSVSLGDTTGEVTVEVTPT